MKKNEEVGNINYDAMHSQRLSKTKNFLTITNYSNILDIGSYEGKWGEILKEMFPNSTIYLADLGIKTDKTYGKIKYKKIEDLNSKSLPFSDDSLDLVTCLEVLEHLCYPDNIISEIYRVLKPGGELILTTPNLGSWSNRLLMIFGYFPVSMSISLKSEESGIRDMMKKEPKTRDGAKFDYHVRAYTPSSLKIVLKENNFEIENFKIFYGYQSNNKLFHLINKLIEIMLPSLEQTILIKCKKRIM